MKLKLVSSAAIALSLGGCSVFDHGARPQRAAQSADLSSYFAERIEAGKRNLAANRPGQAIEAFRQASYHEHYKGEALNGMGVAYSMLGRKDVAQQLFKRAIAVNPLDPRYSRNLARAYTQGLPNGERRPVLASEATVTGGSRKTGFVDDEKLASVNARLADLDRQRAMVEADRSEADRMAAVAREVIAQLDREIEAKDTIAAEADAEQHQAANRFLEPGTASVVQVKAQAIGSPSHEHNVALEARQVSQEPESTAVAAIKHEKLDEPDHGAPPTDRVARQREWFTSVEAASSRRGGGAQVNRVHATSELEELPSPGIVRVGPEPSQGSYPVNKTAAQITLAARDQELAVSREQLAAQQADHEEWKARLADATQRIAAAARRLEAIEEESSRIADMPITGAAEIDLGDAMRDRLARELAAAQEAREAALDILEATERKLAKISVKKARVLNLRAQLLASAEGEGATEDSSGRKSDERITFADRTLNIDVGESLDSSRNVSVFGAVLKPSGTEIFIRTGPDNATREVSLGSLKRGSGTSPTAARTYPVIRTISYQGQLRIPGIHEASYELRSELGDFAILFTAHLARPEFGWPQNNSAAF